MQKQGVLNFKFKMYIQVVWVIPTMLPNFDFSITRKMLFANLPYAIFPYKTQITHFDCFLRQIVQTETPKFFNLVTWACGNYPSIDMHKMVRIHRKKHKPLCQYKSPGMKIVSACKSCDQGISNLLFSKGERFYGTPLLRKPL